MTGDVADRRRGHPVGVSEAAEAPPCQDSMDRRGRPAEQRSEPVGAVAPGRPGGQDLGLGGGTQLAGRAVGPGRAIKQAGFALGPIAADPLVGRRSTDPELLGDVGDGPTGRHTAHQELG